MEDSLTRKITINVLMKLFNKKCSSSQIYLIDEREYVGNVILLKQASHKSKLIEQIFSAIDTLMVSTNTAQFSYSNA